MFEVHNVAEDKRYYPTSFFTVLPGVTKPHLLASGPTKVWQHWCVCKIYPIFVVESSLKGNNCDLLHKTGSQKTDLCCLANCRLSLKYW